MNKLTRYTLLVAIAFAATACEDDEGLDVTDIEIPYGYALSAGTS